MRPTFSFRPRPLALAVSFSTLIAAGGLGLSPLAHAQEGNNTGQATSAEAQTFNIPAGPLSRVLSQFAGAAGVAISFDASEFNDIQSEGLQGQYTVEAGFATLLRGTDVIARRQANGDYVLESTGVRTLAAISVTGSRESAYGPVEGYSASSSASATRTDTPIRYTPVSIQVISNDAMKDQGASDISEAYRNASGVEPGFTQADVSDRISAIIRGFEPQLYYNGFPTEGVNVGDLANIERIEVVKGPASVLYGSVEPGGFVNVVPKEPFSETAFSVKQEVGTDQFNRTAIDANSALNADKSLQGRLNLSYTDSESFRNEVNLQEYLIAPSLKWLPGSKTEVVLNLSYANQKTPWDDGVSFTANGNPPSSNDVYLNEPSLDGVDSDQIFASFRLTHEFTENLKGRSFFQYQDVDFGYEAARKRAFAPITNNKVSRFYDDGSVEENSYQFVNDLQYKFAIGATNHTLLTGIDYRDYETSTARQADFSTDLSVDIENPERGLPPLSLSPSPFLRTGEWLSVFAQDQIRMLEEERLHLLVGGRYDRVDSREKFGSNDDDDTASAVTGRVGALYEVTDNISPFASFSQSFIPVSPRTMGPDGSALDPTTGEQYEAGVKFNSTDERLSATLAAYQVTKDDIPVSLSSTSGSVNGGTLRSRGIELDVTGEVLPGVEVIANYAYTDTEVVESDFLPEGKRFRNVPLHSANLWSTYEFSASSVLNGLTVGGGANYASERLGDPQGTFELDSFVVARAVAWYDQRLSNGQSLRWQLNVENLFDKEYYPSALAKGSVFPGQARMVKGSVEWQY